MTRLFGWCDTGSHKSCRVIFTDWADKTHECSCSCHKEGTPSK